MSFEQTTETTSVYRQLWLGTDGTYLVTFRFEVRLPHYPNAVVVGTGTMVIHSISSSSSKDQAAGLLIALEELSPWPRSATVATCGRRLGANVCCRLGFVGPR